MNRESHAVIHVTSTAAEPASSPRQLSGVVSAQWVRAQRRSLVPVHCYNAAAVFSCLNSCVAGEPHSAHTWFASSLR